MDLLRGEAPKSDINVTPLVDVMLVMLIIFMLVTPLLQQGVGVALPRARHVLPVSENEADVLVVTLTADGTLLLDGRPLGLEALGPALDRAHRAQPGRALQVKADRNAAYGRVKAIVRAGREAGFAAAALVAEPHDAAEEAPHGLR